MSMSVHMDPVLVTLQHRFGHLKYDNNPITDPETIHDLINRLCKQDRNVDMILSEQSIQLIKNEANNDPKNSCKNYATTMPEKECAGIQSAYQSPALNDYIEKLTAHEEHWADVMEERTYQSQKNLKLKYRLHMENLVEKMEKLAHDRSVDKSRELLDEADYIVAENPENFHSHELRDFQSQKTILVSKEQESFDNLSAELDRLIGTFEETIKSPDIQRLNSNLKQNARQVFELIRNKHFDMKAKFFSNATIDAVHQLRDLTVQFHKLMNFMADESRKYEQDVKVSAPVPDKNLTQASNFKFQLDKSASHKTLVSPSVASTGKTHPSVTSSSTPKKEIVNFSFKIKDSVPEVPETYSGAVTRVAYKQFCDALKVLDQLESIVEGFIRQPSAKDSMIIITQSVTNLVNQVAGANFLPSFRRMVKLLRGDQIEISRRYVCLKNNPDARSFCINFMCKRILQGVVNNLKQADSPSSVYNFAAFCVGICSYFPDVQPILIAHLYLKCPILAPIYVKTVENAGTELKSLETIKDSIELNDDGRPKLTEQALQPIVAYAQFYATLFVVPPPPQTKTSPFKIQTLWNLLQSITELPPRFQYTAIVLNEVLKNAGFILWPKFGTSFQNFLKITRDDFVPKMENVNRNFNVGAFVDLIRYLETGDFKKLPRGYLGASIWIPPRSPSPVYAYQ